MTLEFIEPEERRLKEYTIDLVHPTHQEFLGMRMRISNDSSYLEDTDLDDLVFAIHSALSTVPGVTVGPVSKFSENSTYTVEAE